EIQRQALDADWQTIAVVKGTDIASYKDTSLTAGVTYNYRVWAYSDTAGTPFSNSAATDGTTGGGGGGGGGGGVNHAPILAAGTPLLTPVNVNNIESAGDAVSSFAGPFLSDVDGGNPGIAIYATSTVGGHWQY